MAGLNPHSADDYRTQLIALLPTGPAWQFARGSLLWQFADALAQEFARIDARTAAMIAEAYPQSTYEMLEEWETVAGLPDLCSGPADGIAARRRQLAAKLTAAGGQSIPYFLGITEALGYQGASIEEPEPMHCNDDCNDYLWAEDSIYSWIVHAPAAVKTEYMHCNDDCNSYLSSYGGQALECILNRLKPSHTHVSVEYR